MMTTTYLIELRLTLDGSISPYRAATHQNPAEGGIVEDLEITDLSVELREPPALAGWAAGWRGALKLHSICTGVDMDNPEVRKLIGNLLNLVEAEAAEAFYEAEK